MPLAKIENAKGPGTIEPGHLYRLDEFLSRVGWSAHAWRSAKSHGLKPVAMHGRVYIRADDFIAYANKRASEVCSST